MKEFELKGAHHILNGQAQTRKKFKSQPVFFQIAINIDVKNNTQIV